ncbi:DNA/RNA non-specific endonuclease [Xanthomonas prunicola]|uniref:DNA/RNA non-specific endonuclease n=1 Tax=Xanthomonas prunicola TaxID=2053930 RepID=UPI0021B457B9|nr:DNA/RNA non-specific endonuclease [Xanthomonas prunicola]UXA70855.1 DNA/RNA non-specific endonuclease [Xanthomonas prunicola]
MTLKGLKTLANSDGVVCWLDRWQSRLKNSAGYVDELTFTSADVKVPRDSRQTEAGKRGRDSDVGGHAQACSQGGTCDDYNLFPQDSNFNNSAYKVFYENEVKRALSDPSRSVGPTTIKFGRSDPNSPRPDTLSVTYTSGGRTRTRIFENEAKKIPRND